MATDAPTSDTDAPAAVATTEPAIDATTAEMPSAAAEDAVTVADADTSAPAPAVSTSPEPASAPATEPPPQERQREMVADARLGVLRAMFPDFDDSLLQSVLDSCGGDTDAAIDALLGMSDPEFVSERRSVPQPLVPQSQEDMDEQLARTLAMEEQQRTASWRPDEYSQQDYQQRPQAQRRGSEGPEKDTMQEITEQFSKIAESGKRTFGTLFSKVKAKIQELDQPATQDAGYGGGQRSAQGRPAPAAGRHAQQAYYQQQRQAQEQAQMPAYYDPNASSANASPPTSATAAGYDATPASMTASAGAGSTPSPPSTNAGAPQIDGGKLGMLPKRPVSLLRTNDPPAGGAPPSSDSDDELEYAENPFNEGGK